MIVPSLKRRARRRTLTRRIEENIRSGVGLYGKEWILDDLPVTNAHLTALATEIAEWCVETMGSTRRPYGIDQMAMALAGAHPGREPLTTATLKVFRPLEFYQPGGQCEQITEFVAGLDLARVNAVQAPLRVAATLFSWGDIARSALWSD